MTTAEYTFFSSGRGTVSRITHMLGHKRSLHKFKKIESIQNIFSDNNEMKLEINNKRKTGTFTNMWKLNKTLLSNLWVKEEITREIRKFFEPNENKTLHTKTYGMQ